jgi:Na+-driven multidrug efflux pump
VAAVSLIGQSMGKGNPSLAVKYGKICQRMGSVISVILSILYLFGGRWFFSLYFEQADHIATGVQIMQLMVIIVLMQIAQVIYMGCLRGAGDVRFTAMISLVGVAIIRPLSSWLLAYPLELGVIGIWLGCICDQILRLCLSAWRFRSGKWMKHTL